jgi:hypothetical protein
MVQIENKHFLLSNKAFEICGFVVSKYVFQLFIPYILIYMADPADINSAERVVYPLPPIAYESTLKT